MQILVKKKIVLEHMSSTMFHFPYVAFAIHFLQIYTS